MNLCANAQPHGSEQVERLRYLAVGAVLDGDYSVIDFLALHCVEDVVETRVGYQLHAVTEAAFRCLMTPCPLRPQIADLHAALQREAHAHYLAVDALEPLFGQYPGIVGHELGEELALPLRNEDVRVSPFFDFADAVNAFHALLEEFDYLRVDAVYLFSELV